jgi:hypothetical protein
VDRIAYGYAFVVTNLGLDGGCVAEYGDRSQGRQARGLWAFVCGEIFVGAAAVRLC